jgi:hypothetical protein
MYTCICAYAKSLNLRAFANYFFTGVNSHSHMKSDGNMEAKAIPCNSTLRQHHALNFSESTTPCEDREAKSLNFDDFKWMDNPNRTSEEHLFRHGNSYFSCWSAPILLTVDVRRRRGKDGQRGALSFPWNSAVTLGQKHRPRLLFVDELRAADVEIVCRELPENKVGISPK